MNTPNFTLPALTGESFTLHDHLGKIILLNFWSAECPWSKRSDEALMEKLEAWGDDVRYVAVASNANETMEQMKQVAGERKVPLVLHDSERVVADLYGAQTTPHIFLIDRDGSLAYKGAFDDVTFRQRTPSQFYAVDAVNALLAGERPSVDQSPPYGCTIVYFDQNS